MKYINQINGLRRTYTIKDSYLIIYVHAIFKYRSKLHIDLSKVSEIYDTAWVKSKFIYHLTISFVFGLFFLFIMFFFLKNNDFNNYQLYVFIISLWPLLSVFYIIKLMKHQKFYLFRNESGDVVFDIGCSKKNCEQFDSFVDSILKTINTTKNT